MSMTADKAREITLQSSHKINSMVEVIDRAILEEATKGNNVCHVEHIVDGGAVGQDVPKLIAHYYSRGFNVRWVTAYAPAALSDSDWQWGRIKIGGLVISWE